VTLPLARPAIAAGAALALMETLADYGTVSYFAVQTFTTGIYRAWFSLGDRAAAAQLALALLAFVVVVLALERTSRGRARFHETTLRRTGTPRQPLTGSRAVLAWAGCAVPLVFGFLLPAGLLLRMALTEGDAQFGLRFALLARNSVLVAGFTAILAVALALLVGYAARAHRGAGMRLAYRVVGLGYALPGSVIAVGVLIPVTGSTTCSPPRCAMPSGSRSAWSSPAPLRRWCTRVSFVISLRRSSRSMPDWRRSRRKWTLPRAASATRLRRRCAGCTCRCCAAAH
jgi:iron(III) transport system permease protein